MHASPISLGRERLAHTRFAPLRHLTPDSLARQLDEFQAGRFRTVARTWHTLERRDDVLYGVTTKRRKAVSRLPREITPDDDSEQALAHAQALRSFYANLTATSAIDHNERGGLSLLIEQMMNAVGHRYAVHEIVWQPDAQGVLRATLYAVPLWFFENSSGRLHYLPTDSATHGQPLQPDAWMVTVGEGLMEPSSVAWMYKHLPLRDWLLYCERNGMPGVKVTTDAIPNTPEWEAAHEAVLQFGAEFRALLGRGTEIEPLDLSIRGDLPYPELVERMDQAIVALWRGADLTTLSSQGVGASLQRDETVILEQHDAIRIEETLHDQLARPFLRYTFGDETPRARLKLLPQAQPRDLSDEIAAFRLLQDLNLPIPRAAVYARLRLPEPSQD